MCGFAGFLGGKIFEAPDAARASLKTMAATILHRGPDSSGLWMDEGNAIGVVHQRLAILDLSPTGHQPMISKSDRYIIVLNGEIYNHQDLRVHLSDAWRGHSDTETLLSGFDQWGIETTIKKCIGMFAFAVWDRHTKCLTLGRDRIGEKPLYYGWQGRGDSAVFLFGSELKALCAYQGIEPEIDLNVLSLYMRHAYIPSPYSIYQGIFKLLPGSLLRVSLEKREPILTHYWSAQKMILQGHEAPFAGSAGEAVEALEALLKDAVKKQMMADVPVGAFLSGGIDSSTIVALMQSQSARHVKTFSIGFNIEHYNEAMHAAQVARHLETNHTELYVTAQQAQEVIPLLPTMYDEPFADSSQIPTFLVSKLARAQVTVSLSGDGGDELFCGYNRYMLTQRLWENINFLPLALRKLLKNAITALSPTAWDKILNHLSMGSGTYMGNKIHKGAEALSSQSVGQLYAGIISQWPHPLELVIGATEPPTLLTANKPNFSTLEAIEEMMGLDLMTYLPDDILVKVDRAAMSNSLESRVPFLDHRVVEFAWSLPLSLKLRDGQSKWILKQILYRHVPKELMERPKKGFGVPIDKWLRLELREWAEELLDETRLKQQGYLNPSLVRQKWEEHLSGSHNWQHQLWAVLMFQSWLQTNLKS